MADTKIVGGKGFAREEREHKHKHKDDCDCKVHVDHKTLAGNGTKEHPLEVIGFPSPTPPFNDPDITIYVRATGSDKNGKGTQAKPYRTWARGILDVAWPSIVAGTQYYIDCTNLLDGGPEILPANFAMPAWKAPEAFHGDAANPFFLVQTAVNMVAKPRLVASLGGNATIHQSDIVLQPVGGPIVSASFTTPIVITTTAPSGVQSGDEVVISGVVGGNANGTWFVTPTGPFTFELDTSVGTAVGAGGIVETLFAKNPVSGNVSIKTNKTFPVPVGTPPVGGLVGKILHGSAGFFDNAIIYDNDASTIWITLDFAPTAPLKIMEQSAELVTTWDQRGFSGGLNACNIDSMAFNGFNIHPATTGMDERGLFQYGGTVWLQGCDLRGACFVNPTRQANMSWTNLDGDNGVTFYEAFPYHSSSRLVNFIDTTGGAGLYGPQASWGTNIYGGTVYDSCSPVSAIGVVDLFMSDVLIRNALAEGIAHHSGFLELFNVAFENCGSNAVLVTGGNGVIYGKMGGSGWAGAALKVTGGGQIILQPFGTDAAFTNPGDFMEVGTLAPRSFADFRTPATGGFPQQMLDVTGFNTTIAPPGPATFGASGTGSRVSENP